MMQISISEVQMTVTNIAGITSLLAFWAFVLGNVSKWKIKIYQTAEILILIGFICLTAGIIIRGFEANRFPLANLYESTLWFAWAILGGYLLLVRQFGQNQLGWLASLLATMFFLYGSWLPGNQQTITPLVPALVSYWRQIHVPPLIISYALFCLSGLASLLQLWYAGRTRSLALAAITIVLAISAICLGTYTSIDTAWLQLLFVGSSIVGMFLSWKSLPKITSAKVSTQKAEIYDEISRKSISIALPLLTFGVITGGLWANHAWGTYWSWDPKESMALVTWLSYAAYIHLRIHHELSAERLSIVSIIGLILTLLTYLGFNSLGFGGLHSYGRFK
jgi:cytochrome c-type biogenesis protein CcsB